MNLTRRQFLHQGVAAAGAISVLPARGEGGAELKAEVCNPLLRVPLALIVDDSCPVINKAYYWIKARHAWRLKNAPDKPAVGWELHYDKLDVMPDRVPATFVEAWGNWCGEQGIKGKFSMIPFPAGVGRIDRGIPGFPESELFEWLRVAKTIIHPHFDLTPEMITHTQVVDLKTWQLTEAWEQFEWMDPPVDQLTEYVTAAMQLLKNVDIACDGVTSPGTFGIKQESAYARAVLDASMHVNNNPRPFYFLWARATGLPATPIWHEDKTKGQAVASVMPCTADWFGQTGWDLSDPDKYITEDLHGGRLPEILGKELPTILLGHWPCFYANDGPGFKALKIVKQRLDAYDPDKSRTVWMKTSEIGRYAMARQLSEIAVKGGGDAGQAMLQVDTAFPAANFTVAIDSAIRRVQRDGGDLTQAQSRRDFGTNTFLVEGKRSYIAFDLPAGKTSLQLGLA